MTMNRRSEKALYAAADAVSFQGKRWKLTPSARVRLELAARVIAAYEDALDAEVDERARREPEKRSGWEA